MRKFKMSLVILGVMFILVMGGIIIQRSLVSAKQDVLTGKSNIEVQYQRRNDLIPNLVNTVKTQSKNEKEVFTQIAELRSKLNSINSSNDKLNANEEVGGSLNRLLMIAEKYPDLKQNKGFENLRLELEGTENRIATARENFNDSIRIYNNKIHMFPSNIIASLLGYSQEFNFIEATKDAHKPIKVEF